MSNLEINPFQELYVTDSPDPMVYVRLFSDVPVRHSESLFRPGNIVLKGTQGSGKSMLLNLFRPDIRLAYHKAGEPFPVPEENRRFIGGGINLTRSGALDIGQRPIGPDPKEDEELFPLYFADFINYWIVRDLLRTISEMRQQPDAFSLSVNEDRIDTFASNLSDQDCWFGFLHGVGSFDQLCDRIDHRIANYRRFHNFNGDLDTDVHTTKTNIGEPIARTAELMKDAQAGIVAPESNIFIRIDQVERLLRSDVLRPNLGTEYRRVINKAVGQRDSRISYRIGTRRYAWEDDLHIYRSEDKLEHLRDYRLIDLDEMLRRKEDRKTWIFPQFAEDAFRRRLNSRGYSLDESKGAIRSVLGLSPKPQELAKQYCTKSSPDRILKLDETWSKSWHEYLREEFEDDPLNSILASTWARQSNQKLSSEDRKKGIPPSEKKPWERPYWRKERIRQALAQIAARAAQKLKWAGERQVIGLSGGNITVFLSICHEIWDANLRAERHKAVKERNDPVRDSIPADVQTVGIHTASAFWHDKVAEQPKGDDRLRLIDCLGRQFRKWLIDDVTMSYPGHNGFSLAIEDLDKAPRMKRLLQEAVDYGDLVDAPHTTKSKDRLRRKKWYLNTALSPFFQIPESHVKEPYYATLKDIAKWFEQADLPVDDVIPSECEDQDKNQPGLFDNRLEEGK